MCELSGELIGSGDDFARTWTDRGRKPAEGTGGRGSDDEQRDKCDEHISSVDTSGDMGDGCILDGKGGQAKANTTIQMMQGDECVERDEGKGGGQVGREDALLLQATSNRVST
jgi:hypothetical protein